MFLLFCRDDTGRSTCGAGDRFFDVLFGFGFRHQESRGEGTGFQYEWREKKTNKWKHRVQFILHKCHQCFKAELLWSLGLLCVMKSSFFFSDTAPSTFFCLVRSFLVTAQQGLSEVCNGGQGGGGFYDKQFTCRHTDVSLLIISMDSNPLIPEVPYKGCVCGGRFCSSWYNF